MSEPCPPETGEVPNDDGRSAWPSRGLLLTLDDLRLVVRALARLRSALAAKARERGRPAHQDSERAERLIETFEREIQERSSEDRTGR